MKDEKQEDKVQKRDELAEKYGIETDQKKQQIFLELEGKKVILNSIQGLGNFLIVQGEKVRKELHRRENRN